MYEPNLKYKIKFIIRQKTLSLCKRIGMPYLIYRAYWHYIFTPPHLYNPVNQYLTAVPNRGAGIGYQLANWIAGLWFSKQFEMKFSHIPFSSEKWEKFLEFGKNEITLNQLKNQGYSIRRLPKFDENNAEEISLVKQIIASYYGRKIVFVVEQDQFYKDQYGVINEIKRKFYLTHSYHDDNIKFNPDDFNIAVHIRRGDIMSNPSNPNLTMRFLANNYYEKVIQQVLKRINTQKNIHIWLFSQGEKEDFVEFNKYNNLHWCLDMSPQDSFSHMVFADLLITSKSSFSYKPALISNGIKVCPLDFWHSYPNSKDWIMADNYGNILNSQRIQYDTRE